MHAHERIINDTQRNDEPVSVSYCLDKQYLCEELAEQENKLVFLRKESK